ncbi:MAG: hypothetical protein VB055_02005 [Oscillospiraceae bacterium]|nr:hypothetical protein [Oscillospiraceae bacterium]
MLSEQQCKLIETGLTENVEPRKVAAYLCLHMGLMLMEVTALQWKDIDLDHGVVTLCNVVNTAGILVPLDMPRSLPMPPHVIRYLQQYSSLYESGDCYILTGGKKLPPFHHMQNILTTVAVRYNTGGSLSASDLRNAFIRRCIQTGMDLYSICVYVGIKQPNVIAKKFSQYFEPKFHCVAFLEQYGADYQPPQGHQSELEFEGPKRMNLLILGAGSQGPVVKEIAEAIGVFHEIAFLDDDLNNKLAIGPLSEMKNLANRFPMATASFGDSLLRQRYMNALESLGYIVPTLIHPSATISPSAKVARSVLIEARSIISAAAVLERGVLISSASVVEVGARVGQFAHVGSSVTVAKNALVQAYMRVPSGTVIRAE